jgi:hypothetical protein
MTKMAEKHKHIGIAIPFPNTEPPWFWFARKSTIRDTPLWLFGAWATTEAFACSHPEISLGIDKLAYLISVEEIDSDQCDVEPLIKATWGPKA